MARLFDDALTEDVSVTSWTTVVAAPFTMFCWAKSDVTNVRQSLMAIADTGSADNYWQMRFNNTGVFQSVTNDSGSSQVIQDGSYSSDIWHACCHVEAASNSRTAYLDGGSGTSGTTALTPDGADAMSIGVLRISSLTQYISGDIAEPAIWNVALTEDEVGGLANGISPENIRPDSLVFYSDLIRGIDRPFIGPILTDNGGTVSDHPPNIIYPPSAPKFGRTTLRDRRTVTSRVQVDVNPGDKVRIRAVKTDSSRDDFVTQKNASSLTATLHEDL